MKKWKIMLKILSIIFILLVIADLASIIVEFVSGEIKNMVETTFLDSNANISEGLKNIVFYFTIAISIMMEFVLLYLGIKGFNQARGKIRGTKNIILAKVILIVFSILLLTVIPQLINGQVTLLTFFSKILSASIIYFYLKLVQIVTKQEKTI